MFFLMILRKIVYKVKWKNYNAFYVGQTSRKLKTRINEHKNDINKRAGTCLSFLNIDCNPNMILIGVIPKFWIMRYIGKRLVSEIFHIKIQKNGLNSTSDIEFLHEHNQ